MEHMPLHDITEVCKTLGTTSRTLRFYEQKGIIRSTTVGNSARRQYTDEQLALIKHVLVLRALGLSVRTIAALQANGTALDEIIRSRRAEIYASIESRLCELHLLNDALAALEDGKDIFAETWQHPAAPRADEVAIARLCTDAILRGDEDTLYAHVSARLAAYMPRDVYRAVRDDTLAPLGALLAVGQPVADGRFPNKLYSHVRFSKLGLKITYVFHGGRIDGFWLGYYDPKGRDDR